MQTLVIGDIHGCFDELRDLLDKSGIADGDHVIALGDIVDRGPDSVRVLDFFSSSPNRSSLMGNHERKHARAARRLVRLALSQIISRAEFGPGYAQALQQMAAFPLFIELPEAVLAHGYLEPGHPLEEQRDTVLCGTMTGDQYLRKTYAGPWYMLYDGPKPVIVGHHDYLHNGQPLIYQDRVYGLDTSCVHGRALTGMLLPDFKIVSVPSRGNHWHETRRKHAAANPSAPAAARRRLASGVWDAAGTEILDRITAFAQAESQRILTTLQADPGYSDWTPRRQAKAYAAAVGKEMPWSALLHQARSGHITRDSAMRLFASQSEAQDLLKRLVGAEDGE